MNHGELLPTAVRTCTPCTRAYAGPDLLLRPAREQIGELEGRVDRRCLVRAVARPFGERTVPRELQVVPVRVAEIDGEMRAVIGEPAKRDAGVDEPADRLGQLLARGEVERDVVEARHAVRLRRPSRRLPGVEPEMVVIAACREEEDVTRRSPTRHVARLEDDVEAHDADVEVAHAVDVGRSQVDMADPYVRVDRARGRDGGLVRAL